MLAESVQQKGFNFEFEKGLRLGEIEYDYSFNWPYDYFSLVEMVKMEASVDIVDPRTPTPPRPASSWDPWSGMQERSPDQASQAEPDVALPSAPTQIQRPGSPIPGTPPPVSFGGVPAQPVGFGVGAPTAQPNRGATQAASLGGAVQAASLGVGATAAQPNRAAAQAAGQVGALGSPGMPPTGLGGLGSPGSPPTGRGRFGGNY